MSVGYRLENGEYKSRIFKCGTVFPWSVRIPEVGGEREFAVCIFHDGMNDAVADTLDELAAEGKAPYCVCIGVRAGTLSASLEGGQARGMRMDDYDVFGPDYAYYIVKELIPYLAENCNFRLSPSPDFHMTCGGSSGGISAFNMAWYCPEYFHRVYMSSPSFLAMAKGNELPVLMRKVETKPLRIYMEYSETEPDDYFGSSYCAAMEAERALKFAGYPLRCTYFPGEGHCSNYQRKGAALTDGLEWLWEDWNRKPVTAEQLSSRAEKLISLEEPWKTVSRFPAKRKAKVLGGEYRVRGGNIVFRYLGTETAAAEGFGKMTSLALSSDGWRLYAADADKGCVYAYAIQKDGTLGARYLCGALHQPTDFVHPGALDICVDAGDRIYACTELGIQVVRSFGLIDVILPLPGGLIPEKIAFQGDVLYVKTSEGVFCRKMKVQGAGKVPTAPAPVSYYD